MKNTLLFSVLILTAAVAGLSLRLPLLHYRPLHTDEAVHAAKFGDLLEKNEYIYDTFDYHGPTLNYFTLIPAVLSGKTTYKDIDEFTIRIVPVFFGMIVIFLPLLMTKALSRTTVAIAAVLTAVSPAMVFYSRYYIQEMLLICFTLLFIAALLRYLKSGKIAWVFLASLSYGLMGATKETFVIACSSAFFAAVSVWFFSCPRDTRIDSLKSRISLWPVMVFVIPAAVVWVVFYSSFFTNPQGIIDSFRTFTTYLNRAHGEGTHIHPWYYYLQILIFWKQNSGPVFTEAFIVILAVTGMFFAFCKKVFVSEYKPLIRFFAVYTLLMILIYSAISYKTPWCLLGFLSGMIILAAYASACILSLVSNPVMRKVITSIFILGILHLTVMSWLTDTRYTALPTNPYVYSHPTMEMQEVADRIIEAVEACDEGADTFVPVIGEGGGYWPLPWYLRSLNKVGYWNEFNENIPPAPVVILTAPVQDGKIDNIESRLITHLFDSSPPGQKELRLNLFHKYKQIRPYVEIRAYVTYDLQEKLNQKSDPDNI